MLLVLLAGCTRHDEGSSAAAPAASASAAAIAPVAAPASAARAREKFDTVELVVPPGNSVLHVAWKLPTGTGINDDAPFSVRWRSSDGLRAPPSDIRGVGKDVATGFDIPLELMTGATGAKLAGDVDLVVCDVATHSICVPLKRSLELTFAAIKGSTAGRVSLPLPQARP